MRSDHTQSWETAFRLSGVSICLHWVLRGRLIVIEWRLHIWLVHDGCMLSDKGIKLDAFDLASV